MTSYSRERPNQYPKGQAAKGIERKAYFLDMFATTTKESDQALDDNLKTMVAIMLGLEKEQGVDPSFV
jgi:hypothetical protein